jgi:signal peptidase I
VLCDSKSNRAASLKVLAVAGALVYVLFVVGCGLAGHYIQATTSMKPIIDVGDHIVTIELKSDLLNPIKRFDIVTYKAQPNNGRIGPEVIMIHRVIGLPNEKVEIRGGQIIVSDKVLDEPFDKISGGIDYPAIQIEEGEYFLLGDNRPGSLDSRYWIRPTIKREDILGKATKIIHKSDWESGRRW